MKKRLLIVLCACMALGGCGQTPALEGEEKITDNPEQKQEVVSSVQLGQRQGEVIAPVELKGEYERAVFLADMVYDCTGESTLVSPLSLELALGLAAQGCSGETAAELYAYLGREDYSDWAREYMEYSEGLTRMDEGIFSSSDYTFRYTLANSIWVSDQRKLLQEYRKDAKEQFLAEAQSVDFVKNPEKTANKINSWCEEKTNGLIPEMIEPNMLSADLSAILMNSVYFESPWQDKWGTREHEFTDINGKVTAQEMLVDTLGCYYENDYATGFSKSYYNGFSFIGILPKAEGDFKLADLDLEGLMASMTTRYDVRALAPKLDFETTATNIVDILRAQGVEKVFDENASQMDRMIEMAPGEVTYISDILQKCKIELDEEGTRAAAVTAIMVKTESCAIEDPREVREVYLDRPFAFMIYDSAKDKIVFIGKVTGL